MNTASCRRKFPHGFTLVELVITLVIISIIGAVAASRFLGDSTFDGIILREQIISLARAAQQNSLGRTGVSMTIQPNVTGGELTITTADSNGTINSVTIGKGGLALSGDINQTDSCATTNGANVISNASPMTLGFADLGNLDISGVTGNTGTVTSALRVCINSDANLSVCVSPSGFAYAGDCDV